MMNTAFSSNDDFAAAEAPPIPISPRRADIKIKQAKLAELLAEMECEGVLLLEPENIHWFVSGSLMDRSWGDSDRPAIIVNPQQRCVICHTIETQRIFDDALDGLGFLVREWPVWGSKSDGLAEFVTRHRLAVDRPLPGAHLITPWLDAERRRLSPFEQERLAELGLALAHDLEVTAGSLQPGDTEAEVAGQLAHRLLRHGLDPVRLEVIADDRLRRYRRPGFTNTVVETVCQLQATASRFGLFASASRTVCFGAPTDTVRQEFDRASQLQAIGRCSIISGQRPVNLIEAARIHLRGTVHEHDYRLDYPGRWTGRRDVEEWFRPNSPARLDPGQAVVWQATIGSMAVCETLLVEESRGRSFTGIEDWPIRRYVVQGERIDCPDLLVRNRPAMS